MEDKLNIIDYIKARYAVLVIESFEEERILSELQRLANELSLAFMRGTRQKASNKTAPLLTEKP